MAPASAPGLLILPAQTITAAVTAVTPGLGGASGIIMGDEINTVCVEAVFTYGSGGTNATAYLQTSLDGGNTWIDIMSLQFLLASATKVATCVFNTAITTPVTPTDGSLAANTCVSGIIGDRFRVKLTTTGTYAGGTTLAVYAVFNDAGGRQ